LRFSLGGIGRLLTRKLVKPIKTLCSRAAYKSRLDQICSSQAKPDVWAAAARILRKTDAAVRQKLGSFDALDGIAHELAKFLALFVCNGGVQVLHFDQSLAHKNNLSNFRNVGHPGVANELRIEG
jgi:hypothetical protein